MAFVWLTTAAVVRKVILYLSGLHHTEKRGGKPFGFGIGLQLFGQRNHILESSNSIKAAQVAFSKPQLCASLAKPFRRYALSFINVNYCVCEEELHSGLSDCIAQPQSSRGGEFSGETAL